jgi:hypothetical protein
VTQPSPVALNATTTLTATVAPSAAAGTVTFTVGGTQLGSPVTISDGTATLTIAATAANGFAVGPNTIGATYNGNTTYAGSSGSAQLTVTSTVLPPYALSCSACQTTVSLTPGGVYSANLTLTPNTYAGTVTLTPTVTSTNGTASNVTATLTDSQCTFAADQGITCNLAGGPVTPMLTITAGANAANHRPLLPWQSGGAVAFGVLLLGAPFTRRNRRALAVLLIAASIVLLGFSLACGGGSGGGSTGTTARVYTVTVTPSGSGVTNPAPIIITVTVN